MGNKLSLSLECCALISGGDYLQPRHCSVRFGFLFPVPGFPYQRIPVPHLKPLFDDPVLNVIFGGFEFDR